MTVAKKRKYFFPETLKSLPKWETFSSVSQDWNELETSRIGYYEAHTKILSKYCKMDMIKYTFLYNKKIKKYGQFSPDQ